MRQLTTRPVRDGISDTLAYPLLRHRASVTELRHPADSKNLPPAVGGPPHHGAVTRVRDVLLVTIGMWVHEIDSQELAQLRRDHPPVSDAGAFELGHGVHVERLAQDVSSVAVAQPAPARAAASA
jgi:hypothetical protein